MKCIQMLSTVLLLAAVISGTIDRIDSGWVVIELDGCTLPIHIPLQIFNEVPREGMCVSLVIEEDLQLTDKRMSIIKHMLSDVSAR